jgi:hypothetical protein
MSKKNRENEILINPGDNLLLQLPKNQPGRNICCSVRVLNRKCESPDKFVGQIIEVVSMDYSSKDFIPGKILDLPKSKIISANSSILNGEKTFLTIDVINGCISAIHRTDGEIEPVNVRVIDSDCGSDQVFRVDAVSAPLITKTINEDNDLPDTFLPGLSRNEGYIGVTGSRGVEGEPGDDS